MPDLSLEGDPAIGHLDADRGLGDAGVPDEQLQRGAADLVVVRVVRKRPEVELVVDRLTPATP
jgi:hypothetical protein